MHEKSVTEDIFVFVYTFRTYEVNVYMSQGFQYNRNFVKKEFLINSLNFVVNGVYFEKPFFPYK